ncbi:MAG: M67 family metallopeptidase [Pyrinomonadaceae bacterium]|nr:M67 family metallopeptidase [Pyrinomonadaceae bacterium]
MSEDLFREIEELSTQVCPEEAIGLLAGEAGGTVKSVLPLRNIAPLGRFLADPYEQFQAERAIKKAGLKLLAIFHSHPWGGANLSPEDLSFAQHWECAHVVFAFNPDTRHQWELRAFIFKQGSVEEVPVKIEGELLLKSNIKDRA